VYKFSGGFLMVEGGVYIWSVSWGRGLLGVWFSGVGIGKEIKHLKEGGQEKVIFFLMREIF